MPDNVAGRTAAAAVIGGTASDIGGGKFANGATSAAFTHLFNYEGHEIAGMFHQTSGTTDGESVAALHWNSRWRWLKSAGDWLNFSKRFSMKASMGAGEGLVGQGEVSMRGDGKVDGKLNTGPGSGASASVMASVVLYGNPDAKTLATYSFTASLGGRAAGLSFQYTDAGGRFSGSLGFGAGSRLDILRFSPNLSVPAGSAVFVKPMSLERSIEAARNDMWRFTR
jgi:hypothetical protein